MTHRPVSLHTADAPGAEVPGRRRCFCGEWYSAASFHRWPDGLVGNIAMRCPACARPRAEAGERRELREGTLLIEWGSELESEEVIAYGRRRIEEVALRREPPERWDELGLMGEPAAFPAPGWRDFAKWRDARPPEAIAEVTPLRRRRRSDTP